jgi:predicted DNA-binding protein
MADKEMVGVRLPNDTLQRVERYADEHGISKSDALRRMIEKGVDLEEAGLAVAAAQQPKQEEKEEKEVMADGGQVVRPMLNLLSALYAGISITLFAVLLGSYYSGHLADLPVNPLSLLSYMTTSLLVVAVLTLFLYSDYPEQIDQYLYTGIRRVSRFKPQVI